MPMFRSVASSRIFSGFAFPIDSRRGEMIEPQQHRIMLLEYFQRVLRIVFAAYRQDDAAAMQVQYRALDLQVRIPRILGAQLDAVETVFSDDPAPNRIVEIDHERLTCAAAQRQEKANVLARQMNKGIGAERHAHGQPL